MKILCPECGYTREMPAERVPEKPTVALCPSCGCRFQISRTGGVGAVVTSGRMRHRCGDDPLPPSAVIPKVVHPGEHVPAPQQTPAPHKEEGRPSAPAQPSEAMQPQAPLESWDTPEPEERRGEAHTGPEMWGRMPGEEESEGQGAAFNPWEQAPGQTGWLSAFYQTCIRVMFAPARFFASLEPGGATRPLLFYLILCVIQTVFEQLWANVLVSYLAPLVGSDPQLSKIVELFSHQGNIALTLILRCGMATLQLYLFTGLMHFMVRLVNRGNSDFSLIFQVIAYSEATGILCLVPAVGTVAGFIWSIVCILTGMRAALRLSWGQTLVAFGPVVGLLLPAFAQIMALIRG